jgi:hypothetical protein
MFIAPSAPLLGNGIVCYTPLCYGGANTEISLANSAFKRETLNTL